MVTLTSTPVAQAVTENEERAIYDLFFTRGAFSAGQVASIVGLDESVVEEWLTAKARERALDYDPRFDNYCTFD